MAVLGGGAVSYERGAPVPMTSDSPSMGQVIHGLLGYRESGRCSRDTYPESCITMYTNTKISWPSDEWTSGVPREQKMLKGHLPRVIHHQAWGYSNLRTRAALKVVLYS